MTTATAPAKVIGSGDLVALLRVKYPIDAYAVLEQVRDGAGFNANRTGDVMVMGLWPSRGLSLQGFEVKVSRADWLREVKQPQKAESLYRYCDHWWLLASAPDLVQDLELPETWGLLAPKGRGLGIVKQAPRLTPEPMNRSMLAALLKRAWMRAPAEVVVEARIAAAKQDGIAHSKYLGQQAKTDLENLRRVVGDFEKASGIRLDGYSFGAEMGEAVRLLTQRGGYGLLSRIVGLRDNLRRLADDLGRVAELQEKA